MIFCVRSSTDLTSCSKHKIDLGKSSALYQDWADKNVTMQCMFTNMSGRTTISWPKSQAPSFRRVEKRLALSQGATVTFNNSCKITSRLCTTKHQSYVRLNPCGVSSKIEKKLFNERDDFRGKSGLGQFDFERAEVIFRNFQKSCPQHF